jgi:hypothetical protein
MSKSYFEKLKILKIVDYAINNNKIKGLCPVISIYFEPYVTNMCPRGTEKHYSSLT